MSTKVPEARCWGPEWGRRHGIQGVSHPTGQEQEEQERQREAGSLAGVSPSRAEGLRQQGGTAPSTTMPQHR